MPATDAHLTPEQRRRRTVRREALAAALVKARQAAGLTQTELAEAADMSRSAVARLEAGTASIGSDRLWDLAIALGMRPSALFAAAEADAEARDTLDGV
ncbi:helix-turn-helix transcriptional regulator [Gordonia cholesterolivorans]|uniref:HTH cro/C1-type domain-containing protein n=1 Tax=Gordonia cholesterolivorans TaxID=559625 RepID=A0ABN3HC98_9ACTN